MSIKAFKKPWRWLLLPGLAFLLVILIIIPQKSYTPTVDQRQDLSLNQRIEIAFQLADIKLKSTIDYLNKLSDTPKFYPNYTYHKLSENWFNDFSKSIKRKKSIPEGIWIPDKPKFWAAGAFPGLLWKMSLYDKDPIMRQFWANKAKRWGEPLRAMGAEKNKDLTINNLFVFKHWFENTSGTEQQQQLETILQGTRQLAKPFAQGRGTFDVDIGVMGFERKAERTDKKVHWQAFMDHTINVEQLLWAADHNPNLTEANDWRNQAIRHIKTIAKTFGKNRKPGHSGTWQRGYFDNNPNSSTYGKFLFNEGKQGWKDSSTWSRGQAWFIYGSSITYQYTKDPQILSIAKEAINYFLENLPDRWPDKKRRPNDFIPTWDFDYALEQDINTEKDSSAAAIAVSGIVKLLKVIPANDPDYQRYLGDVKHILWNLTSNNYLPGTDKPEMSLLSHGCYHHFKAINPSTTIYDNGLIWGDYFFIDALIDYQTLTEKS